jgi:hypothetical protein
MRPGAAVSNIKSTYRLFQATREVSPMAASPLVAPTPAGKKTHRVGAAVVP